jgi:hypothetical protein
MKCHGITEEQAEDSSFVFICTSCRRKGGESDEPKLPSLKLRLTSQSPSTNQTQANGATSSSRRLESVQIPTPSLPAPEAHMQHAQPWVDGPSLSPRGQALGPPGIQRSEAAYGSPSKGANGSMSSPIRARPYSPAHFAGSPSKFPTSSPPPYNLERIPSSPTKSLHSSPTKSLHMPQLQQNGSSFASNPFSSNPFGPRQSAPYNRRASATSGSPIKHSPANSPRLTHALPTTFSFNSPHSSFPPSSQARQPSFSPTKHSSPAPLPATMSSPAPLPFIAPSPSSQMPAQMLPDPIPAPSKHDGVRPQESDLHVVSETPLFPPISMKPLSSPMILDPPVKKDQSSPAPERLRGSVLGDGNGASSQ